MKLIKSTNLEKNNYYTRENWRDLKNYDIAINVDSYGVEKTAEILAKFIDTNNIVTSK